MASLLRQGRRRSGAELVERVHPLHEATSKWVGGGTSRERMGRAFTACAIRPEHAFGAMPRRGRSVLLLLMLLVGGLRQGHRPPTLVGGIERRGPTNYGRVLRLSSGSGNISVLIEGVLGFDERWRLVRVLWRHAGRRGQRH